MTESEKIAYAKSFIDKLANGINPLDDTPIPDDNIINNVRLSRCFFYISGILQKDIEREERKLPKGKKPGRLPFSISAEKLERFEFSSIPISATAITRKLNWLVMEDIAEKRIARLKYRQLTQWLIDIGMIENRKWGDYGKTKKFPTAAGEEIGLVLQFWENYGRKAPVIFFTESAQRFVIDNIEGLIATRIKEEKASSEDENDDEAEND